MLPNKYFVSDDWLSVLTGDDDGGIKCSQSQLTVEYYELSTIVRHKSNLGLAQIAPLLPAAVSE